MRTFVVLIFFLLITGLTATAETSLSAGVEEINFDVYVDGKMIGNHNYRIIDEGDFERVENVANFRVSILFITAFRFSHENSERWSNGCLVEFEAKTRQNGERINVSGERTGEGFLVDTGESRIELPECVSSFAYWDPKFLERSRLLNPQSGEYLDVSVEPLPQAELEVRGEIVTAIPYKLTANKLELTLWYSPNDEWLALESIGKGGRVIRYELS